jgi:amidase
MRLLTSSWQARADAKAAATLNKIHPEWRLSPIDLANAKKQRDLTGPFIQQFLETNEVSIISKVSVDIVGDIKEGRLTAVQVTNAFCKTAAIAHQIVSSAIGIASGRLNPIVLINSLITTPFNGVAH